MRKTTGFFLALLLWAAPALALTGGETGAPASLAAWEAWVLQGFEDRYFCPAEADGRVQCAWPVSLNLDLRESGGQMAVTFELRREGSFPLPGGPGAWPEEVVDAEGRPVPVLGRDRPTVWLPAGRHTLNGLFHWKRLPETITLPLGFVLSVAIDGRPLDFPGLEVDYQAGSARLWLTRKGGEAAAAPAAAGQTADGLTVRVNRLVRDTQPMMVTTRVKLVVSGPPREVILPEILLPDSRAMALSSPLPAQLVGNALRINVKPGVYEVFADSRSLNTSENLGPAPVRGTAAEGNGRAETAPGERAVFLTPEYWAWQAQPELRLAEVSGAEQIDPSQADIDDSWRNLPIYAVEPGAELVFTTIRRGDPEPQPDQLRLARECWLDYDGGGLSCRDRLTGILSRQWHLNTSPPFTLSQAALGDQPQVITWQTDSQGRQAPGLQLREGRVDIRADLRLDDFQGLLPASGWDHKLETEGQKLNLPPGYHLFHASGAEVRHDGPYSGSGSWTGAWGTLDFFIVLIITIAVWKLYGRRYGLPTLLALALAYHEPLAPRMVFLHVLACAALLRILPSTAGKAYGLVRFWRLAAGLTLLVCGALFLINQARVTLHPQLEDPSFRSGYRHLWSWALPGASHAPYEEAYYDEAYGGDYGEPAREVSAAAAAQAPAPMAPEPRSFSGSILSKTAAAMAKPRPAQGGPDDAFANRMVHLNQAPDAKVQNSAPRPDWDWRSVRLYYNESVSADQEVRLYVTGPAVWRILGVLRIISMIWLMGVVLETGGRKKPRPAQTAGSPSGSPAAPAWGAALLFILGLSAIPAAAAQAQEFPDQSLLEAYRARLLAAQPIPEPGLPLLTLTVEAERLTLDFTVEAAREAVFSLPALDRDIFQPTSLSLDGLRDWPLLEDNGRRLTLAPPGRHRLILAGRLKKVSSAFQAFQISFPAARPRRTEVAENPAWQVEGLEHDGQLVGGALYLTAVGGGEAPPPEEAGEKVVFLDPFFEVQRTLSLGLEWRVHTVVRRLTPSGAPVSLRLPLLDGERPVSGDLRPDNGRVTLNFGPQAEEVRWESSLSLTPDLTLTAGEGPWTESWSLDVSPIWRVAYQGLIPVHNTRDGFWQPQWRPWPGESLRLAVDRPQPVPGEYMVIDHADLRVTAGENNQLARLGFKVRTSQGGPYSFSLPAGAEVREFTVDGRSVPSAAVPSAAGEAAAVPAETAPVLTASLTPGDHEIAVSWVAGQPLAAALTTPALDLGVPTANVTFGLTLPEDRWILWTWGPLQGPAVQFWSLLALMAAAAFLLSRGRATPLGWWSWFLLGLGLMQLSLAGAMAVAGWLLILGRRRIKSPAAPFWFNAGQVGLVIWTLAALILIYKGIEYGLLRNPDMLIAGGGSYGQNLSWFIDRAAGPWPTGGALSTPVWFYKTLMLAWSLWLAVSLVKWLKWGWGAFSHDTLWKKHPPKPRKKGSDPLPAGPASPKSAPPA